MARAREKVNHRLEFANLVHTTLGETLSDLTEINKRWPTISAVVPQRVPVRVKSNEVSSGHGNEFDAVVDETQVSSKFDFEMELEPASAGHFLAMLLGEKIATTGTGVDYANRYIHQFGFADSSLDLKLTAVRSSDGEQASVWQDMGIQRITISGSKPKGSAVKIKVDMVGSGRRADDATAAAVAVRAKKCRMSNFKLVMGPQGTAEGSMTDYTRDVESFELVIENGLAETHRPDTSGNGYANTLEHSGERKVTLKVTLAKTAASATLLDWTEQNPREATACYGAWLSFYADDHAVTGPTTARLIKIKAPQLIVTNPVSGWSDGNASWDLDMQAVRQVGGDGYTEAEQGPVTLYIDNGTAAATWLAVFTV